MTGEDITRFIDSERMRRRLTQDGLSALAGFIDGGQLYRRMWERQDTKTTNHEKFLNALGYTLRIVPIHEEGRNEKQSQ